jgi:hypothetical protein
MENPMMAQVGLAAADREVRIHHQEDAPHAFQDVRKGIPSSASFWAALIRAPKIL